jgi:hypothetical protein
VSAIWQRLGIAPTSDLKAIKSAYAARLKHTKPDDDAAAYQALREAYEAAKMQAKRMVEESAENDAPAAIDAEQPEEPPASWQKPEQLPTWRPAELAFALKIAVEIAPAAEEEDAPAETIWLETHSSEPDENAGTIDTEQPEELHASWQKPEQPPTWRAPAELAQAFKQKLDARDRDATLAEWKILEHELDNLPLSLHDEASRCFADAVLTAEGSPPFIVRHALRRRFSWLNDFRVSQTLGWQRARDLHLFFENDVSFEPDEAFLNRYRDIFAFVQDMRYLQGWRLMLYPISASSRVRRLWRELEPVQRKAMDIEQTFQNRISAALDGSGFLRLVFLLIPLVLSAVSWGDYDTALTLLMTFIGGLVVFMFHTPSIDFRQKLWRHRFFGVGDGRMWQGIPVRTLAATACLALALAGTVALESGWL